MRYLSRSSNAMVVEVSIFCELAMSSCNDELAMSDRMLCVEFIYAELIYVA